MIEKIPYTERVCYEEFYIPDKMPIHEAVVINHLEQVCFGEFTVSHVDFDEKTRMMRVAFLPNKEVLEHLYGEYDLDKVIHFIFEEKLDLIESVLSHSQAFPYYKHPDVDILIVDFSIYVHKTLKDGVEPTKDGFVKYLNDQYEEPIEASSIEGH